MNAHIKKEKWADAVSESSRQRINPARNNYVATLFLATPKASQKP
jgi:hypothetical protein